MSGNLIPDATGDYYRNGHQFGYWIFTRSDGQWSLGLDADGAAAYIMQDLAGPTGPEVPWWLLQLTDTDYLVTGDYAAQDAAEGEAHVDAPEQPSIAVMGDGVIPLFGTVRGKWIPVGTYYGKPVYGTGDGELKIYYDPGKLRWEMTKEAIPENKEIYTSDTLLGEYTPHGTYTFNPFVSTIGTYSNKPSFWISGDGEPDPTGDYYYAAQHNGRSVFLHRSGTFAIFHDDDFGDWVIAASVEDALPDKWGCVNGPEQTYTAQGTYDGSPVVAHQDF